MIRDRGRMKWVSLMLPEHVKVLREWAKEDFYKERKELDEQELEVMNSLLVEAMEEKRAVTITYYRKKQYEPFTGFILGYDALAGCIKLADASTREHRLYLQDIIDVQWAEEEES